MNPIAVTCRRTIALARNLFTTALATGGFLAAVAVLFAMGFQSSEGTSRTLVDVWSAAVSPVLPVLASLYGMDVWSEERRSGRTDLLLSVAIRERDLVVGKFLGVFLMLCAAVLLSLVTTVVPLALADSTAAAGTRLLSFLPAMFILILQGSLWCAVSTAVSVAFTSGAVSACASVALISVMPRASWEALRLWAAEESRALGEMPFDAQVADFTAGVFSTGTILTYLIITVAVLFVSSKGVSLLRFAGAGAARSMRGSTYLAMALAFVCAGSMISLALRLDATLDVPIGAAETLSPRLCQVLSESSGRLAVTEFLPRGDRRFRTVARTLRVLRRRAASLGGLVPDLAFVDPNWDLGSAERLIRMGAKENSVVFERGRRFVSVPIEGGLAEDSILSAIMRLVVPPRHREICWTTGHGESEFDSYGNWGMSDIARELVRDGYRNCKIDLASDRAIPSDCALVIVAGAKDVFSRVEQGRLDSYLKGGGRLLALIGPTGEEGVSPLLPSWGIRPVQKTFDSPRTLSGTDVIASCFADHAVSSALAGSRIVLEKPLAFIPSAATAGGTGAEHIEFTPLATVGGDAPVAAVERGAGVGADLAIRPTRIVVIGDPSFAMNGQLAARACANRDFFLNAVAFLSGTDTSTATAIGSGTLVIGLDRAARFKMAVCMALVVPLVVVFVLSAVVMRRRMRR